MKYKYAKLRQEYQDLAAKNARIVQIAMEADYFSQARFSKEALITDVMRTEQDQIQLYGYPKPSLHMYGRAIDLRSWIYDEHQIEQLVSHLNSTFQYDPSRPDKKVAIYHKIKGNVFHFHLQVHPNTARLRDGEAPKIIF